MRESKTGVPCTRADGKESLLLVSTARADAQQLRKAMARHLQEGHPGAIDDCPRPHCRAAAEEFLEGSRG